MGMGNFEGGRAPTGKYRDAGPWAVQKWLNRSRCRLRLGLRWAKVNMYYVGVHSGANCSISLHHPCMAAMRPFVKLLWRLVLDVLGSGYVIRGESVQSASVSSLDFCRAALVNIAFSRLDEHISDPKCARMENFAQKPLNIRKWYPTTCAATPLSMLPGPQYCVHSTTTALALLFSA